jgi:hypothetical protein
MVATSRIAMADISRQKCLEVSLDGQLTPRHTVGQAIEYYLEETRMHQGDVLWSAYDRGVKLDNKSELADVSVTEESEWTIMPQVSAGS